MSQLLDDLKNAPMGGHIKMPSLPVDVEINGVTVRCPLTYRAFGLLYDYHDVCRVAVWDLLDTYAERHYLFMRKWLPWFANEPVYLWNGGWDD